MTQATTLLEEQDASTLAEFAQAAEEFLARLRRARVALDRLEARPLQPETRLRLIGLGPRLDTQAVGDVSLDGRLQLDSELLMVQAETQGLADLPELSDGAEALSELLSASGELRRLLWEACRAAERLAALDDEHRLRFRQLVYALTSTFRGSTAADASPRLAIELSLIRRLISAALEDDKEQ